MSAGCTLAPTARDALLSADVRVVVTGASGWMGMATLDMLAEALGERFAGRVVALGSRAATLRLRDGTRVAQQPLAAIDTLSARPTWVLHYAFLTKDRVGAMPDADYAAANRALAARVLGALDRIGATGVFLPSSGAAAAGEGAAPAMRLYGALKRADEADVARWAEAAGTRAVIARVFALAGPYLNKPDHYALARFIADAGHGGPIRITATRPVHRGFAAVTDLVSLALCLLAGPAGVTRFDAQGTAALEMAEIARAVADALGAPARIERPPLGDEPAEVYAGDPARYLALCRSAGIALTPLADAIRASAAFVPVDA